MSWRPKDWHQRSLAVLKQKMPSPEAPDTTIVMGFLACLEAGADAMLEALEKEGLLSFNPNEEGK